MVPAIHIFWTRVQALAWVPALAWCALAGDSASTRGYVVAGIAATLVSLAGVLGAPRSLADVVTLLRAALAVAVVGAPWWLGEHAWWAWSLLALALLGDLLDGAIARRLGGSSQGALLDMECDQLTVLAMSWMVVARGGLAYVLLLPAMRYLFVLAAWSVSMPASDPKPIDGGNRRGRAVCAAVVVALLLALTPSTPIGLTNALTGVAVGLLSWSFASDWVYLFARRRPEVRT